MLSLKHHMKKIQEDSTLLVKQRTHTNLRCCSRGKLKPWISQKFSVSPVKEGLKQQHAKEQLGIWNSARMQTNQKTLGLWPTLVDHTPDIHLIKWRSPPIHWSPRCSCESAGLLQGLQIVHFELVASFFSFEMIAFLLINHQVPGVRKESYRSNYQWTTKTFWCAF